MKNVNMKVDGNILTLTVDLSQNFGLSKGGKSNTVATTGGNLEIPSHPGVRIGLNAFKLLPKS